MFLGLPENHSELGLQAILGKQHGVELLILRLATAFIFAANAKDQHVVGGPNKRVCEGVAALSIAAHEGHYGNLGGLQRSLLSRLDLWLLGHSQVEPGLLGDVGEHALTNHLPEINIANPPGCEVFGFLNFSKRRPNLF